MLSSLLMVLATVSVLLDFDEVLINKTESLLTQS